MKTELDSPKGYCVEKGVPNNLYLYNEPVVVALCRCLRGMHHDELRICYVFLAEIARAKRTYPDFLHDYFGPFLGGKLIIERSR